jgi:HK97 family phage portal protein
MGIRTLVRRLYNLALDDPKAWDEGLWRFRGQMVAGENVNEATALTYSAVWNAVELISGTIAALPLNLYSRKADSTTVLDYHPVHRVLHTQANEYMNAMQFRECQLAHLLLWGNAYAEIVRDGCGQVVALWPITPNRVKPAWHNGALAYEIKVEANKPPMVMQRADVLHVPGLGFDGIQGYSVVGMARKSIGLGLALETFGAAFFSAGTHPGIIVRHPGRLSPEGHKNLQAAMSTEYSGLGNAHRLMLLQENMSVERPGIPPEDAQFLETKQHTITDMARWFNLPPHKLKDLSRSSFSNIDSEQISFVTDSLLPRSVRLESCYNTQLLTPWEQRSLYTKHVLAGLMRGSNEGRANFYYKLWSMGALRINEARDKEDMNPVEGGDELFVPANMVPLSRALDPKYWTEKVAPAQPPALAPDDANPDQNPEPGDGKADVAALMLEPHNGKGVLA